MSLIIRQWNLLRGFLSRIVSFFERRNPEALLELEQENLRKRVMEFNSGLVAHAAASERLTSQVNLAEAKIEKLADRIRAMLKAENGDAAARLALERQEVEAQLAEDRKQRNRAETTFRQLVETRDRAVGEARRKIEALRRDIGDLKTKRALANLEAMALEMSDGLAGPGDSMNRLREIVDEARHREDGRLRVYGGPLDAEEQLLHDQERAVMAQDALAGFLRLENAAPAEAPRLLEDLSKEPEAIAVRRTNSKLN